MNPDVIWIAISLAYLLVIVNFVLGIKLTHDYQEAAKTFKELDAQVTRCLNVTAQVATGIADMADWGDKIELELKERVQICDDLDRRLEPLERLAKATSVTVTPELKQYPKSDRKTRAAKKALGEVADSMMEQIKEEAKKLDDSEET